MKINKWDYSKLHLDTNYSKGTACNRKGYGCKWTWQTIKHSTWTQIIVKEQRCYCSATFGSLCRVFNNEHNSYPKVRETALAVERFSVIFAIYNCIAQMRGILHENKIRDEVINTAMIAPDNKSKKHCFYILWYILTMGITHTN